MANLLKYRASTTGLQKRVQGDIRERQTAWETFCDDEQLRCLHRIEPNELEWLRRVALMGTVFDEKDFLFVLKMIRISPPTTERSPAEPPAKKPDAPAQERPTRLSPPALGRRPRLGTRLLRVLGRKTG